MHDTIPASVTLYEWSVRNASRIGLLSTGRQTADKRRGIQHAVLSHGYIRSECSLIC